MLTESMRGSTLVLAVCHVAELVCAMILALSFGLCIAAAPSNVALCSATMSPARRGSRFENNTRPTRMHTRIVRANMYTIHAHAHACMKAARGVQMKVLRDGWHRDENRWKDRNRVLGRAREAEGLLTCE